MKVFVTVKRVLDHNIQVRVKTDNSDVDLTNCKMGTNSFCEIAVEEAVRLKEQGIATEVIVLSAGPKVAQEQIRSALALGADRGIHIETDQQLEPLTVAKMLAKLIEQESPDLVIMGKQSIDSENSQTGPMLAALTGWPQGTFASEINLQDSAITVAREVDKGIQTLELQLPAIVTCDLRLNEPRFASLPNIMKAKRKPIATITPSELGVCVQANTRMLRVEQPSSRPAGVRVNSVEELVQKLKLEAGVI